MAREHDQKAASGGGSGGTSGDAGAARDPRHMQLASRIRSARKYNEAHPDLVAQFNEATGGGCAGADGGVDVRKVIEWQRARGLKGDAKVGGDTVKAAQAEGAPNAEDAGGAGGAAGAKKKEHPGQKVEHVDFGEEEADPVTGGDAFDGEGVAEDGERMKNPVPLAERAVEHGANKGKLDVRENPEEQDKKTAEAQSTFGGEGIEKGADAVGIESDAVKGVSFLAKVPQATILLREHRYSELRVLVTSSVGFEDRFEFVKHVIEGAAGEVSPRVANWLTTFVACGKAIDVSELWYEWVKLGLESMKKEREDGLHEADAQIYAYAYSDIVVNGAHDGAGAVSESQKKATEAGIADGKAMLEANPELRPLLLAEYDDKIRARREVESAVMKEEGFGEIK
jgi:peptidoglycan hydrolase-like protein with peptidoglycan-binding domain